MVRVAVVGTGAIAGAHLACLRALPDVDVVGVADRSLARAEAVAERFAVPRFFADIHGLLGAVSPDVVHVTTPASSHLRLATVALQAGAHVIVEKPVTPTYEEWLQLRDVATRLGLRLMENQNYRFSREVRRVREMIRSGHFGEVHQVDVTFFQSITRGDHPFADPFVPHPALSLPGGPITDFLPHMASLVHTFLGPHTDAHAMWLPGHPSSVVPYVDMVATVRMPHALATLSFNGRSSPDGFWVSVYGDRAQARINLYEGRLTVDVLRSGPTPLLPVANAFGEARGTSSAALRSLWGKLTSTAGSYEGLWFLLTAFYDAIASGAEPPLSLTEMDETAQLVAALTAPVSAPA